MKKSVFGVCFWVVFWVTGAALAGVPGALDTSPAATLIVPFFEVGINASTHSQDTFAIVYNRATTTTQIHYHVWDKNGNALTFMERKSCPATGPGLLPCETLLAGPRRL